MAATETPYGYEWDWRVVTPVVDDDPLWQYLGPPESRVHLVLVGTAPGYDGRSYRLDDGWAPLACGAQAGPAVDFGRPNGVSPLPLVCPECFERFGS